MFSAKNLALDIVSELCTELPTSIQTLNFYGRKLISHPQFQPGFISYYISSLVGINLVVHKISCFFSYSVHCINAGLINELGPEVNAAGKRKVTVFQFRDKEYEYLQS